MDRFEEAKLRIKEATDLVALIESYIPLKARGRNLMANCPFHAENTPSFSVSREGQFFHCFGCGKSGDVFTWLQERDGVTFREAMEILAERAGIDVTGVFGKGERRKGPDPYAILSEVATFFHRQLELPGGRAAREYLVDRGLEEAILPWYLGSHPPRGALGEFARANKLPPDVLESAGLMRSGREPFAGRVMFPIHDERGRVVAFGGRVVPGTREAEGDGDYTPPKYLNSPESPFFNKRRLLFGLHHTKQAGQRQLLVMEGYTDVIACHAAGFTGAVASLGTAFTADHSRLIERYALDGIVLMFDGDRAGRTAAERAMRELVNSKVKVRMVVMSDAGADIKDPADMVTARAGEDPELVGERRVRFADIIEGADDDVTVWFRLLRGRLDLHDAVDAEAAARECVQLLQQVENGVRRAALRQQMARHLAVPEGVLQRMMDRAPRRQTSSPGEADAPIAPAPAADSPHVRAEAELLACMLAVPGLLRRDYLAGHPLEDSRVAALLEMAAEGLELGRDTSEGLLSYLFARVAEEAELRTALGSAADRSARIPNVQEVFAGLVVARRRLGRQPGRRALREQLAQALAAGDRERAAELQARLLETMRLDRPRKHESPQDGDDDPDTSGDDKPPPPFLDASNGSSPSPD